MRQPPKRLGCTPHAAAAARSTAYAPQFTNFEINRARICGKRVQNFQIGGAQGREATAQCAHARTADCGFARATPRRRFLQRTAVARFCSEFSIFTLRSFEQNLRRRASKSRRTARAAHAHSARTGRCARVPVVLSHGAPPPTPLSPRAPPPTRREFRKFPQSRPNFGKSAGISKDRGRSRGERGRGSARTLARTAHCRRPRDATAPRAAAQRRASPPRTASAAKRRFQMTHQHSSPR